MPTHLDHIIILLPHAQLLNPPAWLTRNFTISPGGKHSDGKTENRLICFRDGSYIELISFIDDDPERRRGHWWDRGYGIVDFALTTTSPSTALTNHTSIQTLLTPQNLAFEPPRAGGRLRPDGVEISWLVTFPSGASFQRGEVPFFCHDVTPRRLRVPGSEAVVTHPCGAYGVDSLTIYVPEERVAVLCGAFEAILGTGNSAGEGGKEGLFRTTRLEGVRGGEEGVGFRIRGPEEGWVGRAVEERGGLVLGDLVLGGVRKEGEGDRIDVMEDGEQGSAEFGVGRVLRG